MIALEQHRQRLSHRPAKARAVAGDQDVLTTFRLGNSVSGRREFVRRLGRRALEEPRKECGVPPSPTEDARRSDLRRGWYWGSVEFAEKLLELAKPRLRAIRNRTYRSGGLQKSHDVQAAERLVREGLKESGLRETDLAHLPGSEPRKIRIAQKVWRQTSVSQGWIAKRLQMRSAANVSQQLRRYEKLSRIVD
jgi:putative transposase